MQILARGSHAGMTQGRLHQVDGGAPVQSVGSVIIVQLIIGNRGFYSPLAATPWMI
jgi:hypothetical protein